MGREVAAGGSLCKPQIRAARVHGGTCAISTFARRLRARIRARIVESGVTAFAALRLPLGAPHRQFGFFPGISWGVVLQISLTPPTPSAVLPGAAR